MGRAKLLRSVIVLTIFYVGGAYIWFLLMTPNIIDHFYHALPVWMRIEKPPEWINPLASAQWQLLLLKTWSLPLLMGWCTCLFLGLVTSWLFIRLTGKRHISRGTPRGELIGGCHWTMGALLGRQWPVRTSETSVEIENIKFDKAQQALADEMMGVIYANADCYAGDGHGVNLYDHTLNVLNIVSRQEKPDPLVALAAIGHDIGKTVAYTRIDDDWEVIADHGIASGRLVAMMPSFARLPESQSIPLHNAIRYSHAVDQMPVNQKYNEQSLDLIEALKDLDGTATREEKALVIEKTDPKQAVFDAFWQYFGEMTFYRRNMARKEKTVGWRSGSRLFMNEQELRRFLEERMDRDLIAALGKIRRKGKIHRLTENLMVALQKKGFLITSIRHEGYQYDLPPEAALWSIKSGNIDFNGVFIVDLKEAELSVWPEPAPFNVYATGPATAEIYRSAKVTKLAEDIVAPEDTEGSINLEKSDTRSTSKKDKSGKREQDERLKKRTSSSKSLDAGGDKPQSKQKPKGRQSSASKKTKERLAQLSSLDLATALEQGLVEDQGDLFLEASQNREKRHKAEQLPQSADNREAQGESSADSLPVEGIGERSPKGATAESHCANTTERPSEESRSEEKKSKPQSQPSTEVSRAARDAIGAGIDLDIFDEEF